MAFAVDEDPPDKVSDVAGAVVFERIAKEVEDMNDAAVGTGFIFPDVSAFHDLMVP
jgi:hypothetical protein